MRKLNALCIDTMNNRFTSNDGLEEVLIGIPLASATKQGSQLRWLRLWLLHW
eukprot:m.73176 g.73176  ORF g.73176 m.73176 type:complete len:52 (-) comp14313_c0_seq1:1655-1810(-)